MHIVARYHDPDIVSRENWQGKYIMANYLALLLTPAAAGIPFSAALTLCARRIVKILARLSRV
jgi:hypothetical protein